MRNLGRTVHGSVACTWGEVRIDETGAPVRAQAMLDLNILHTGIARRDAISASRASWAPGFLIGRIIGIEIDAWLRPAQTWAGRGGGHRCGRHRGGPAGVEPEVTTVHDPNRQIRSLPRRPARCLRHHVWMAACDECRVVRASLLAGGREGRTAAR